jgi:hypothetical protein
MALGLTVMALEKDHAFQEAVLSIYHATMHTFTATNALKIIENHLGKAFLKLQIQAQPQLILQQPPPFFMPKPVPPSPPSIPPATPPVAPPSAPPETPPSAPPTSPPSIPPKVQG